MQSGERGHVVISQQTMPDVEVVFAGDQIVNDAARAESRQGAQGCDLAIEEGVLVMWE